MLPELLKRTVAKTRTIEPKQTFKEETLPSAQLKTFALTAKPSPPIQYHFMTVCANKLQVDNDEVLLRR